MAPCPGLKCLFPGCFRMEIRVHERVHEDLRKVPDMVGDTLEKKVKDMQSALDMGASPAMVFEKYLSGDLHPILQKKLGRDHRVWSIEGRWIGSPG